jgi:thymidylate synthase (FAD)
MNETMYGIEYSKPEVILLQETGIGVAEIAARTCYDSFDSSEHSFMHDMDVLKDSDIVTNDNIDSLNNIESSNLLDDLAWTYFHHSILEHANLSYLIKGTSRGVLQEHARHRIQAISVRSTRYTMQSVLHAFNACKLAKKEEAKDVFTHLMRQMDMFIIGEDFETLEIHQLYDKFLLHLNTIGKEEFGEITLSKSAKEVYYSENITDPIVLFNALLECKNKRNVGDAFKWVVTDNWKVDMVVTFNLRSLKNYFTLRDSGAAYFQIKWLAQAMMKATPSKYLDLIVKKK